MMRHTHIRQCAHIKSGRAPVLVLGMALTLLLTACSSEPAKGPQAMVPEVGVVTLKPSRVVVTTDLVGRTASFLQAEVRPQVRGIIRERFFTEGGDVQQGQVLYQIEPESYQATYDNANAALSKAEANLVATQLKARRISELRKTNAISQQDKDDSQAAYLQSQAEVAACRAALDAAQIELKRTRITAPISGRISKSSVTVGALVTAEQTLPLATIHQLDPMYVDVTKSAEDVLRLRKALATDSGLRTDEGHAQVRIIQGDGTEYPYPGTMQFTDVGVNEATGTVTLRAEFPNPKHDLLPGLYVQAVLTEGMADDALLVPQRSVLRDNRGDPLVLVVNPDGIAERRAIKTSRSFGESWSVLSGLKAGEQVVVEGIQKVRPGSPVRAVPMPEAPVTADSRAPATEQAAPASTPGATTAPKPDAKSGS